MTILIQPAVSRKKFPVMRGGVISVSIYIPDPHTLDSSEGSINVMLPPFQPSLRISKVHGICVDPYMPDEFTTPVAYPRNT